MRDTIWNRFPACVAALVLASGCAGGGSTPGQVVGTATPLYVELTVVNDYSRYQDLGINTETDTGDLINRVNVLFASSTEFTRYAPQILLVSQRTITSSMVDPLRLVDLDTSGNVIFSDALSRFAAYRSDQLALPPHASDAAILLTHRPGSGGTISLAYTWQVCNPVASAAVVQVNFTDSFDASSVAHALGHLLGMCHDPPATRASGSPGCRTLAVAETGATCANRIMSASSDPSAPNDRFSACSAGDLNDFVDNRIGIPNCLTTPAPGVAMSTVENLQPGQ
ncbi:MAG: M12 family metallo-peptidase [Deltaproteobacteria bacterium]